MGHISLRHTVDQGWTNSNLEGRRPALIKLGHWLTFSFISLTDAVYTGRSAVTQQT